jgi:hypothetical protein
LEPGLKVGVFCRVTSADSYNVRFGKNLGGVGSSGQYNLNSPHVVDDLAADIMTGGGDRDWFFVSSKGGDTTDAVKSGSNKEQVNAV